jgi:hypothetical protein
MDVSIGMLPGSPRWDIFPRDLWRFDGIVDWSGIPITLRKREERGMVLSFLWVVTLTAPLIALMLSAGCSAVPRPVSEVRYVATGPNATAAQVSSDVAGRYWKREQSREIKLGPAGIVSIIDRAGPPDEELSKGRRIAITEFSVEFVDAQIQNPFGHPTLIKTHAALAGPTQPGAGPTSGADTRPSPAPLSNADQVRTAEALRAAFEQYLRESGLFVVPQAAVTSCAGYANLKPKPSVNSSWALFFKPGSTDTGVVFRTHTVAAPGLGVATCGAAALASAEAQIQRETNADVVMAVKLRVGTFQKKAALEQESVIRWTAGGQPIVLTAQRALVSDDRGGDASRFLPVAGGTGPVEEDHFTGHLEQILPTFIGLAFPTLQGKAGHQDPFAQVAATASP